MMEGRLTNQIGCIAFREMISILSKLLKSLDLPLLMKTRK